MPTFHDILWLTVWPEIEDLGEHADRIGDAELTATVENVRAIVRRLADERQHERSAHAD